MTLRKKSVIFVLIILGVTIGSIFTISNYVLIDGLYHLEEERARENVKRAYSALLNDISSLADKAVDWSAWDDTYNFIVDGNEDFIKSNLVESTFVNLKLNLMMFIDTSGMVVWGKAFDLVEEREIPVPQAFSKHLAANELLLKHTGIESRLAGIMLLRDKPMLVVSQPILTSSNEGPVRGTLIMGRYLNEAVVERLAIQTRLSLTVDTLESSDIPGDFHIVNPGASVQLPVYVQVIDPDTVSGYTQLNSIHGKAMLLLKVDMPRDIYRQGRGIIFTFMSLAILTTLLIGIAVVLLLNRWVLSRVVRLNKNISLIGTSGNLTARVVVTGTDELGGLAIAVNKTLDALEKSEARLRESEGRFRRLAENSPNVISRYELLPQPRFTYISPAIQKVTGFTPEEFYRDSGLGINLVHPDDRLLLESVARGEITPATPVQIRWQRKDGSYVWMEIRSALIRDDVGSLEAIESVAQDITGRLRAEEERKRMEDETQVASRLALIGQMASGIAHEINNPLTSAIGFAQLIAGRDDIPEDARAELNIVVDSTHRAGGIIKRLLTFARQHKPERTYLNINEIVTSTLELRAYSLRNSNIAVNTIFATDRPSTVADAGQLQQVFLNLIINAEMEMHTAHGKGNLLIKTEVVSGNIRVSVKDDGPGIPKENMERLFTPFFTTREVGKGTGLGLSICHGIITQHQGRIYAESKPGEGATFFVELPVLPEQEQPKPEQPAPLEAGEIIKTKILVVDDEPSVRQFLRQVLSQAGHTVETVSNGTDALEKLNSEQFDLILADVKMPGMSGIDLFKQIQSVFQPLANRVIFITGDVIGLETQGFLSETRASYITKPFDAFQLVREINLVLAKAGCKKERFD